MTNSDKLNIIISKFGNDYLPAKDNNIHYCCPFCISKRGKADNDYKLYVSIPKLIFYCFKCHVKGRLSNDVSLSNDSVYKSIMDLYSEDNDSNEDEYNMFYLPNKKIPKGTLAHEYLLKRGISDDLIEYYNIRMGIDNLFGRIVVPNILYGQDQSWTDMYSARSYTNQDPKYRNPEGCKKTNAVFNLHNQKKGGRVYVVEGAITSICAGKDSICVYGSSPSDEQIAMIANFGFSEIYCVLDNDPSGRKGNVMLSEKLSNLIQSETTIYTSHLPEGIDAADVGEEKFKKIVEENKVEYFSSLYTRIFTLFK